MGDVCGDILLYQKLMICYEYYHPLLTCLFKIKTSYIYRGDVCGDILLYQKLMICYEICFSLPFD